MSDEIDDKESEAVRLRKEHSRRLLESIGLTAEQVREMNGKHWSGAYGNDRPRKIKK